ncbi:MAG: hypothetical protein L0Y56_07610, partial [Nitrospira sp.]|nr:hypothetical protein [Nitrospira sp.]
AVATIGTYRKKVQINFDLIHCNERSHITAYIEKSDQYFQVSMGMYVFRRDILSYMQPQQHMDFPGLLRRLLEDGQSVMSYPFNGYWLDIGNHSDYTRAVEEFEWMKDSLNIDYSREGGEVLRTEQG